MATATKKSNKAATRAISKQVEFMLAMETDLQHRTEELMMEYFDRQEVMSDLCSRYIGGQL